MPTLDELKQKGIENRICLEEAIVCYSKEFRAGADTAAAELTALLNKADDYSMEEGVIKRQIRLHHYTPEYRVALPPVVKYASVILDLNEVGRPQSFARAIYRYSDRDKEFFYYDFVGVETQ